MNKKEAIISTYTGKTINLADPNPHDIDIMDIAIGLAREKRWANQSRLTVSVAEHSFVGCILIGQEDKLGFLLHDGAEAFFRDVASPIKHLCTEFTAYEQRMRDVIMMKWGCVWNQAHEEMDMRLRDMEMKFLIHHPGSEKFVDYSALYKLYDERMAFEIYMNWFKRLTQ